MFIKLTYIFDNINITSKPCIIKVSLKSNMAIVQIDIWDSQSGLIAKMLINCCFNISSYITTICSTNMNPGISQYKNCWKQGHTTFACHFQDTRCLKCNGPHKVKHHHHFAWCCKANLRLTLSVSKPNKANYALILSNISTTRVITKQIPTPICSGIIISTKNGM